MSSTTGSISAFIGSRWAVIAAAAALAAGAVVVPTVTGNGGGLPSGVTLTDADGGATYYSQWSNTIPSDPSFIPIGIFNAHELGVVTGGTSKAAKYKALGMNIFVSLFNGFMSGSPVTEAAAIQAQGMYAIASPEDALMNPKPSGFDATWGSTIASWVYQDEAEGNPCSAIYVAWVRTACTEAGGKTGTASYAPMTALVHSHDSTRPVYNGFTNGYVFDWFLNGSATELATGSDMIGFDVYPMVDRRSTFNGSVSIGHVYGTYETVVLARGWAGNAKPIWPDIETSEVDDAFNPTCYRPTAADVKALVWNSITAGARGIVYFNNNFASGCTSPTGSDVLLNAGFSDIATAVTDVNAQVTALAPVINGPFAVGFETHTGSGLNTMTKYLASENAFYVFATPKQSASQTPTFTVKGPSSNTVTVVNESRTIPVVAGQFSDTFGGETVTHIYKIPNS